MLVIGLLAWRRLRPSVEILSLVMFRSAPLEADEAAVRGLLRRVLGHGFEMSRLPLSDHAATAYAVKREEGPPLGLIDARHPYCGPDELRELLEKMEHPVAREALARHTSWFAVDMMAPAPRDEAGRVEVLVQLARIAAELMDDKVLLLFRRDRQQLGLIGPETEELLRQGKIAELFADRDVSSAIVSVRSDDALVNAAMDEARRRLPEFLDAIREQRSPNGIYGFKARFAAGDGGAECIWLSLKSVSATHLIGVIENFPKAAHIPAKGETVRVPLGDVVDWAWQEAPGKTHGLFTERALAEAHK